MTNEDKQSIVDKYNSCLGLTTKATKIVLFKQVPLAFIAESCNNDAYIERVRDSCGDFLEEHEDSECIRLPLGKYVYVNNPTSAILVLLVNALIFGYPLYLIIKSCLI